MWIAFGPDGTQRRVAESVSAGIRFGFAVAGGADFNGDLHSDLVIGADEYSPPGRRAAGAVYLYTGESLPALSRLGNVDFALGPPADVLRINSSTGAGLDRSVVVTPTDPLVVTLDRPPSLGPGTAAYALYFSVGATTEASVQAQQFRSFFFGYMGFPTPLGGGPNSIRKFFANIGFPMIFGPADFEPPEAPATVISVNNGAQREIVVSVQGFLENDQAPSGVLAITNGITLRVEEP